MTNAVRIWGCEGAAVARKPRLYSRRDWLIGRWEQEITTMQTPPLSLDDLHITPDSPARNAKMVSQVTSLRCFNAAGANHLNKLCLPSLGLAGTFQVMPSTAAGEGGSVVQAIEF